MISNVVMLKEILNKSQLVQLVLVWFNSELMPKLVVYHVLILKLSVKLVITQVLLIKLLLKLIVLLVSLVTQILLPQNFVMSLLINLFKDGKMKLLLVLMDFSEILPQNSVLP